MFDSISRMFHSLNSSSNFNIGNVTAVIGVILAAVSILLAVWPLVKQRRREKTLEKSFGADFYDTATIKRATRYYVRPNCSSVDPGNEAEMRQVIATEEDLFSTVTRFLAKDTPHRYLLLLADSGMGKSSFVINYYAHNLRLSKRKKQRLAVVPLGIPDALETIAKIDNKKNTVIFLDAFDEDTKAIKDHRSRLSDLMQACMQFKRVLITCRTQFFPKDEEIPQQPGITRVAPRLPGEKAVYEFWKLYLSPLNDEQVDAFIRKRYPLWQLRKRSQARELINRIPFLSVRPMLLAYTPDLLENRNIKFKYSFQVYEVMINKWLERESGWIDPEVLLPLSENLAIDMYMGRVRRGSERITRPDLNKILARTRVNLEDWKITGRSLLNRDASGNLKFAHRSIMEYLFVKKFAEGNSKTRGAELTDNMKRFLLEMIHDACKNTNRPLPTFEYSDLFNAPHLTLAPIYTLRSVPKRIKDFSKELSDLGFFSGGLNLLYDRIYVVEERNKTLIITDYASGLQWQQRGSEHPLMQESAEQYIWRMNDTEYGGYTGWRLPTLPEVLAMIGGEHFGEKGTPILDEEVISFWISDSAADHEGSLAVFYTGAANVKSEDMQTLIAVTIKKSQANVNLINKHSNGTAYVRAVRNLESATEAKAQFIGPRLPM